MATVRLLFQFAGTSQPPIIPEVISVPAIVINHRTVRHILDELSVRGAGSHSIPTLFVKKYANCSCIDNLESHGKSHLHPVHQGS